MKKLWILFVVAACMPTIYLGVRILDLGLLEHPVHMFTALMFQVLFLIIWLLVVFAELFSGGLLWKDIWLQEVCISAGLLLGAMGCYYIDSILVPGQHINADGWIMLFGIQAGFYLMCFFWKLRTLK